MLAEHDYISDLIRLGEMPICLTVRRVELSGLQELLLAFLILPRSVFNGSQTRVALGAGIAQFVGGPEEDMKGERGR